MIEVINLDGPTFKHIRLKVPTDLLYGVNHDVQDGDPFLPRTRKQEIRRVRSLLILYAMYGFDIASHFGENESVFGGDDCLVCEHEEKVEEELRPRFSALIREFKQRKTGEKETIDELLLLIREFSLKLLTFDEDGLRKRAGLPSLWREYEIAEPGEAQP